MIRLRRGYGGQVPLRRGYGGEGLLRLGASESDGAAH
jgi:hypothetical protein